MEDESSTSSSSESLTECFRKIDFKRLELALNGKITITRIEESDYHPIKDCELKQNSPLLFSFLANALEKVG